MKTLTETLQALIARPGIVSLIGQTETETIRAALDCAVNEDKRKEEALAHALLNCEAGALSIAAMVAALNCDFDRLEELREEAETHRATIARYAEKMDDWQANADAQAALEELADLEEQAGDHDSEDDAREAIQDDPLSVQVRSGWCSPGEEMDAEDFEILLTTGGPALRIVGELDQYKQPCRAWLEYQDWFTPWTEYHGNGVSNDDLLTYCQQFYFGG